MINNKKIIAFKNNQLITDISTLPFKLNRQGFYMYGDTDFGEQLFEMFPRYGYVDETTKKFDRLYYKKYKNYTKQYENAVTDVFVDIPDNYETRFGYFSEDANVHIIVCITPTYNITYYMNEDDTYIILCGDDSVHNAYLHFYESGYGKQFESKMCKECYKWLCENILPTAVSCIHNLTQRVVDRVKMTVTRSKLDVSKTIKRGDE